MKRLSYLLLLFTFVVFASCKEDEVMPEPGIKEVHLNSTSSTSQPQEIQVVIQKPTPCYQVRQVNETSSGTNYYYDIILDSSAEVCADVIAEEVVTVVFAPQTTGEHLLSFLINGKLYQTRTVQVTD